MSRLLSSVREGVQLFTMNSFKRNLKVAILTDHCFNFGGAIWTTKCMGELFDTVDYFFLMGKEKEAREYLNTDRVYFSRLNRFPFLKRYYKYTYPLWPTFVETFDFSEYDLVLSSSFSVAHGCITSINTKHIAYIHTPMRYAWDLYKEYFGNSRFLKRAFVLFFTNHLRIWDTYASQRADLVIANSNFVKDRIKKYWRRDIESVIYPPVQISNLKPKKERDSYFVSGAPFEENKGGEFLFECAKELKFNIKVIGTSPRLKKFKRRYSKVHNIEFLGRVSEKEKKNILANAKGYIATGIEDFGIFPVEAMSFGTPVLAYYAGGYMESVIEGVSGVFFKEREIQSFKKALKSFNAKKWDYIKIQSTVSKFSKESFKKELEKVILKNI